MSAGPVAAVDVGTNSVRLLVASAGQPLTELERLMTITRLGRGVDANGRLDDEALERTVACIEGYAQRWRELGAQRVRVAATSAVRDAGDRERFRAAVLARAGVEPEVLSWEDEARAAFRGAIAGLPPAEPPYLVVDIGGGSTELILGVDGPDAATSRQLGCVRLTERCLFSDPPRAAEVSQAADVIAAELDSAARLVPGDVARTLVAVAGTATTVAALHLGLERYEPERIHGTRVPLDAVAAWRGRLAGMTSAERAALGPMAPGREDVIVAGALILEHVLARFGFAEVLVSEHDILDGLALSLLDGA